MFSCIKVTFSSVGGSPIGTINFGENMAPLVDMDAVMNFCQQFRKDFNEMGEPLNYAIEYKSEDV